MIPITYKYSPEANKDTVKKPSTKISKYICFFNYTKHL